MKKTMYILLLFTLVSAARAQFSCTSGEASLYVNDKGLLSELRRNGSDHTYLFARRPSPLLQIQKENTWLSPINCKRDPGKGLLSLTYPGGTRINIRSTEHDSHLTLEIIAVQSPIEVSAVIWGPYATTIGDTVGEIIGVVRDHDFAFGIQGLNPKTVGGKLENKE
jgi:hypothetical protein